MTTLAEAEAAFQAAINAGDWQALDKATDLVNQLEPPPARAVSLHSAALWYASLGIPTFPLSPGSKIPFKGSRGLKDATTDPTQIDAWWTKHPDANIGVATGHTFDVVDVDGPVGQRSRAEHWETIFAKIDADQFAKVLTPTPGGLHLYVAVQGDGNATNLVPGVDYRGLGGYVVAPPSVLPHGAYRFLGTPEFSRMEQVAA